MGLSPDHYLDLKGGIFDGTTKEQLDHLFQTYAQDPRHDRLALHFHGGLVDRQAGMTNAEQRMEDFSDLNAYQVFFIWQTGLLDAISGRLHAISNERIFQRLLMRLTQFATAKLKQRDDERGLVLGLPDEREIQQELDQLGRGQEPFAEMDPADLPAGEQLQRGEANQFSQALARDPVVREETLAIAQGLRSSDEINIGEAMRDREGTRSTSTQMSPDVLDEIRKEAPEPETRGVVTTTIIVTRAVEALAHVIKRFADRRDHGVYATVLEELVRQLYLANIGGSIWDQMKQDTIAAFGADEQRCGGTRFLQRLKEYCANEQHSLPHITLVGHSAGAIYICTFLQYADKCLPKEVTFDIVFLAPACTFGLFSQTYERYKHRIAEIRVFGMGDKLERADHLPPSYLHLPPIYTHSLLYLVSGLFEAGVDTPLVGMQRYYSKEALYDVPQACLDYLLNPLKKRFVWSKIDGGGGLSSGAITHGHFYGDPLTRESLRYIIAHGL